MKAGWTGRRLRCVFLSHSFLLPSLLCTVFVYLYSYLYLYFYDICLLCTWMDGRPRCLCLSQWPDHLFLLPSLLCLCSYEQKHRKHCYLVHSRRKKKYHLSACMDNMLFIQVENKKKSFSQSERRIFRIASRCKKICDINFHSQPLFFRIMTM